MVAGRVEWSDLDGLVAAGQVRAASDHGGAVVCDLAAAGQYALELEWSAEALVRAAGARRVEADALPSFLRVTGAAGGRFIAYASRDPVTFGGAERLVIDAHKQARRQNAAAPLVAMLEAVKLHYLAVQRVTRMLVRGSTATDAAANVGLLPRPPGELPPVPPGATTIPGVISSIPGVTMGPGGVSILPGAVPGAPSITLPLAGFDELDDLGAVAFGEARSGEARELATATIILIGVLGSAALAAGAWVVAQVHGQNVEMKIATTKLAEQARVASELAAAKIAAGQPVDVPEVVRSLGVAEERRIVWSPWLAAGLGVVAGGGGAYAVMSAKGAR
jgi:hypothetical protein